MLLNTRFYVDSLDRKRLFSFMQGWLIESNGYHFGNFDFDFGTSDICIESDDHSQKLFINNYDERFTVQLITNADGIINTVNFVLDDVSDKPSLHISLDKSFLTMTTNNDRFKFYLPRIVRTIFWEELGGDDNGILTDDKPFIIRKNHIDFASDFLLNKKEHLNPIVYVSVSDRGVPDLNCDFVARELAGQAHVFVENSPLISDYIKERVMGEKPDVYFPTNGEVEILLPNGESQIMRSKKTSNFDYTIINSVRRMMAAVDVPSDFDILKIKHKHIMSKLADGVDKDVYEACEQIISEKDAEISSLRKELNDTKSQLHTLSYKAEGLRSNLSKLETSEDNKSVSLSINGSEMYQGEIVNVILKVLRKEYDLMKDDANLSGSRKFDVLGDVLEHNFPPDTGAELADVIKSAFNDGALTKHGIGSLRSAGFVVEKGNKHYKIYFDGFEKYSASISTTPSDVRGSKNFVTDFLNTLSFS